MFPLVAPGVHPPHGPLGDPAVGTWPLAECVRCAFSSAYAKSRSAHFPLRSEHQYWHCLPACLRRRTQSLVLLGHLICSPLVCVAGGVPGPTRCFGCQSCPRWSASVWKWSCLLPPHQAPAWTSPSWSLQRSSGGAGTCGPGGHVGGCLHCAGGRVWGDCFICTLSRALSLVQLSCVGPGG